MSPPEVSKQTLSVVSLVIFSAKDIVLTICGETRLDYIDFWSRPCSSEKNLFLACELESFDQVLNHQLKLPSFIALSCIFLFFDLDAVDQRCPSYVLQVSSDISQSQSFRDTRPLSN